MTNLTQPLRDEHKELYPNVNRILKVAESVGEAPFAEIQRGVDEVYDFLAHHLKPHAQAEEAVLYPTVQSAIGSEEATQTMARDHVEVGRYIDELAELRQGLTRASLTQVQIKALQRVLYGVYALLKVHFAKEEEVYLPILDKRLTAAEAHEMFEAMESAAHAAKHAAHG